MYLLKGGLKKILKPTIMEFDRQVTWSICRTHNTDSRQFPTTLPRSVSLNQADRSHREPLDGCVTLGRAGNAADRLK